MKNAKIPSIIYSIIENFSLVLKIINIYHRVIRPIIATYKYFGKSLNANIIVVPKLYVVYIISFILGIDAFLILLSTNICIIFIDIKFITKALP